MGCGSCGSGGCSTGGCGKSGGCATGGCNKLNTFDWFSEMLPPDMDTKDAIYEVRFKNTNKAFYRNAYGLPVMTGDMVAVEGDRGFNVGQISLGGVLARLQMKKKKVDENKLPKIFRKATQEDLEKLAQARSREPEALVRSRSIVRNLNLEMKLSEVEFQGDNTRAIFYYIADQRVDFRELIKVLADEFKVRVEMKQIGLRHEAGLVGGIGSCGRELCCSTWLTDFKSVPTSAARYQNIALNPMKISGQCGRLKCCLNYELETYMDAWKGIPEVHSLKTEIGTARLQKTDIFKRTMWFSYESENNWIPLSVETVIELLNQNKQGVVVPALKAEEDKVRSVSGHKGPVSGNKEAEFDFVDVVGQSSLRTDELRKKKKGGDRRQQPQQRTKGDQPVRQQQENRRDNRNENRNRNQDRNRPQGEKRPREQQIGQEKPQREQKPREQQQRQQPKNNPEQKQKGENPEQQRKQRPKKQPESRNRQPRPDQPGKKEKPDQPPQP